MKSIPKFSALIFILNAFTCSSMADVVLAHGVAAVMGEMEGVDRCGRAFSAYRLGHVDTRQTRLVVYAVWNSSRQAASTLFGEGWRVPMLESRMYPIGVDAYEMLRADGGTFCLRERTCEETKDWIKQSVWFRSLVENQIGADGLKVENI